MNLEFCGYNKWDVQVEQDWTSEKYQRRVDTDEGFGSPLCQCNDRLFINIERFTHNITGTNKTSSHINLVHENSKGEWCDIGIYSLSDDQLMTNIEHYEKKLLTMWEVFCDGMD